MDLNGDEIARSMCNPLYRDFRFIHSSISVIFASAQGTVEIIPQVEVLVEKILIFVFFSLLQVYAKIMTNRCVVLKLIRAVILALAQAIFRRVHLQLIYFF